MGVEIAVHGGKREANNSSCVPQAEQLLNVCALTPVGGWQTHVYCALFIMYQSEGKTTDGGIEGKRTWFPSEGNLLH